MSRYMGPKILWDTVDKVCILLECFLLSFIQPVVVEYLLFPLKTNKSTQQKVN